MTSNLNDEKNIKKLIFDARNEFLVNKNIPKAINNLLDLLKIPDIQDKYIIKNALALAYLENKDYVEASKIFNEIGEKYQAGFCELLLGNIDKTISVWENLPECSAVNWGISLLGFVNLDAKTPPSFLQIRNYLESDIGYFIKADKIQYAENVIAYSDYLVSVHPESYKFIGKALLNNGYPGLAMNYFSKACETIPNDAESYYLIAQYFIGQESYYEAKQALKRCLSLNKNYVPAKKQLDFVESKTKFKLF